MRTREGNSPDWIKIGDAIRNSGKPIRQIAREEGLSDTALRKRMKKEGWVRPDANQPAREPTCELPREPRETRSETRARSMAAASVKDLTARGRNIILALMDEMEFLNGHHETIAGMVDDYVNGSKDASARAKLLKVLDHETRAKTANYLATALAKLNDAVPGKKEQAEEDAKTAGQGSGWGDDLDSGIAGRPN